jgi:hypothetical protein
LVFLALALVWTGCGYHAIYGGATERFSVVLSSTRVPDAIASDEVVSGLRETLAQEGALAGGGGYPRIEVEVLRGDETSEGIAAASSGLGGSVTKTAWNGPRARGTEVGLVARACVVRARGGRCERDTGDVRAMDLVGSDLASGSSEVATDAFHHRDALRAVGHRLGERLARHILGGGTASDEAVGRER